MAVGFPTKVDYATGDVLSATNMNDLSGTVNLLNGTQYSGGKNRVLNSAMQVWQRGTSFTPSAVVITYTADRWCTFRGVANYTVSRQATSDTTNLPNIQYCQRVQRTAATTNTDIIYNYQSFESVNSIPLAGKSVTLSFYARAGANYSAASNALSANLYSGTGTDQNYISGYTGTATIISSNVTLTTTWQRFTLTGTVASTATELTVLFGNTPVGTAGANDYYEITGVQLEASTVASAFATNGGTYQAELAACQRYYWRWGNSTYGAGAGAAIYGPCYVSSSTVSTASIKTPVTMRNVPTLETTGTAANYRTYIGATQYISNSVPTLDIAGTEFVSVNFTSASNGTIGYGGYALTNGTPSYLGFSAEL